MAIKHISWEPRDSDVQHFYRRPQPYHIYTHTSLLPSRKTTANSNFLFQEEWCENKYITKARHSDIIIVGVNTSLKEAEELVGYLYVLIPFPSYISEQLSTFERDTVSLKIAHNSTLSKFPSMFQKHGGVSLQENITQTHRQLFPKRLKWLETQLCSMSPSQHLPPPKSPQSLRTGYIFSSIPVKSIVTSTTVKDHHCFSYHIQICSSKLQAPSSLG